MASGDFCEHDWPGSGCPDCRRARETRVDIVSTPKTTDGSPKPAAESSSPPLTVEQAFEIGFCWRGMLMGQTLEDSRAVCRTLAADIFDGLEIDACEIPGFESADVGIHHAKRAILKALGLKASHAASASLPSVIERMADAGHELALYASYAEVVGAIGHNRKPIREWSDKVFALHHEREELEKDWVG